MTASSRLAHIKPFAPDLAPASPMELGADPRVRFTGDWEALLWDLACLDPVWLETASAGVAFRQSVELRRIRVRDGIGLAEGANFGVYCFLGEWHALSARAAQTMGEPDGFDIEARDRGRILSLSVDTRAHAFALRILMDTYQAASARVVPFPRQPDRAARLARHLQDLASAQEASAAGLEAVDIAEACGWLTLAPARMQVRGHTRRALPELIPCFLEAIVDQALPVRMLTGTLGAAQTYQGRFHDYWSRRDHAFALVAEGARLTLEPSAIASAWVVERPSPNGATDQLRLYDEHGQLLLLLEQLPSAARPEGSTWRRLLKALLD